MKYIAWLVASAAAAFFVGCTTPSVHPVYTDSSIVADPTVVGTWRETDGDDGTYTITPAGNGYHMLVKDNDKNAPRQWEFTVKLTRIGSQRFADVSATEPARETQEDKWGPLFVPTHMFCRYAITADTLDIRVLDRAWLRKAISDGQVTLGSTPLNSDLLITSETPALRAFLDKFGGNDSAFSDHTRLIRVKP